MATKILTQKPTAEELALLVLQQVERLTTKTDRAFALFSGASSLIRRSDGLYDDENVAELLTMGFETLGDASELRDLRKAAETILDTTKEA
jgi:hypothetical protein